MPLPEWFWTENDIPAKASFHQMWRCPNWGTPNTRMIINRGNELRVSWIIGKDNRLMLVRVKHLYGGGYGRVFALVVGWPSNQRWIRWLPLPPKLLEMVQTAYEEPGMNPAFNDIIIKIDPEGRYGYESCGSSALLPQISLVQQAKETEQSVRSALAQWPGPAAQEWF